MINQLNNPLIYLLIFLALGIIPFLLLSITSFIKLNVVFGILRNALGAGQIPSGSISALLSLILSMHIMLPVIGPVLVGIEPNTVFNAEQLSLEQLTKVGTTFVQPIEEFLKRHSRPKERIFFSKQFCAEMRKEECKVDSENFFTLVPAFVISELDKAFSIGFTIFLPFLVIDIVVANLLIGLGMMMVNPVSISLPFKLILFVLCDGWFLLCKGLVLGYQ